MKSVAIIGTREPDVWQDQCARSLARKLSKDYGITIVTGGAYGIDQAAMVGAVRSLLQVYLPWESYNDKVIPADATRIIANARTHPEWFASVDEFHPNPAALKQGGRALMARNYGIVAGRDLVVAFPNHVGGGGTGQGIRIAQALGIPLIQLNRSVGSVSPKRSYESVLVEALTILGIFPREAVTA